MEPHKFLVDPNYIEHCKSPRVSDEFMQSLHEAICKVLKGFKVHVLEPEDPVKIHYEKQRNKKLKKTSMQAHFQESENQEEENLKLFALLKKMYKDNNKARQAID